MSFFLFLMKCTAFQQNYVKKWMKLIKQADNPTQRHSQRISKCQLQECLLTLRAEKNMQNIKGVEFSIQL